MKTVLFVPGFQEDIKSRDYASVIVAIKKQGYKVIFMPISWKRTTIDDWARELDIVYKSYNPSQTILAGFSYGAMTAFMSAIKQNPSELWLFSLSPYFAEDSKVKNMKTQIRYIGHRRITAFSKLIFKDLVKNIRCKTLLFIGQIEIDKWPNTWNRLAIAHKLLQNNKLIIVPKSGHDVANSHYVDAIIKAI